MFFDIAIMLSFGASIIHLEFAVFVVAGNEVEIVSFGGISNGQKCGFARARNWRRWQTLAFARIPWASHGI